MKQRPILFNGAMVRAILDGSKTQTRRIADTGLYVIDKHIHGDEVATREIAALISTCKYGLIGDQLWVRETFGLEVRSYGGGTGEFYAYRATNPDAVYCTNADGGSIPIKWAPSIHMPRKACRITLEITAIRVERLRDISEEDAKAEGVMQIDNPDFERPEDRDFKQCPTCGGTGLYTYHSENGAHPDTDCTECDSHKKLFKHLWNSTGGDWEANPWVWVIEFKRVTE